MTSSARSSSQIDGEFPFSDEASAAADRGRLEAPAHRPCPGDLVEVDRGLDPFDGDEAEGLDLNETLRQPKRRGREQDAPGGGELLHARRE